MEQIVIVHYQKTLKLQVTNSKEDEMMVVCMSCQEDATIPSVAEGSFIEPSGDTLADVQNMPGFKCEYCQTVTPDMNPLVAEHIEDYLKEKYDGEVLVLDYANFCV